jgi:ATP-dependent DNA helicase 2 subunit 2
MISDRKVDRVEPALNQMKDIIDRYIRGSINGDIYDKALECLLELRQACVSEDEAPFFNKFMETLKEKYSHDTHKDFFGLLIKMKLSLITSAESELSSIVTAQEAENFLKLSI